MVFESSIFIPAENKKSDLVLSQKITYSFFGIIIFSIISLKFGHPFFTQTTVNFISFFSLTLAFIAIFGAGILRLFEYEILNGHFKGQMKINSEALFINDTPYKFSEISNLKLTVLTYKGQRTNNRRTGASFHQGISNSISFSHNSKNVSVNFLLKSKNHIEELYHILISIITQEKINYSRNLINLIPDNYRNSQEFKNFILKLIIEKRLECTEGLLIHGYSSDEEAKQLRAKYCQ
jgi:hypothetical protein